MPRFSRATILLLAGVAAACSDAPPETTQTSTAPPVAAVGEQRWGDGRALAARVDVAEDRLVVATTIGVSVQTGDEQPVELYEGLTSLLALSPDGRLAAFTTAAGRLEIWDVAAGQPVSDFDVAPDRYTSLAFSSPTDVIAGGERDVTRYPADGNTAEALVEAPADGALGPVAIATDGTVAVPIGAPQPTVAVWTAGADVGTVDMGLAAGTALVGVVWSGDGRHLAVLHQPPAAGETIAVWDVDAAAFRGGGVSIPNYVTPQQVAFQGADRVVIPLADRLAAFDLDGAELESLPITSSEVPRLSAVSGSEAVVVTGWDGRLRRWTAGESAAELAAGARTVVDQSMPAGSDGLVTVDHFGLIRQYDLVAGGEVRAVDRYAVGEANSVDVSPDGASVAMGMSTGAVRVLRTADGTLVEQLDRPEGNVAAVAFAPSAPLLATGISVQVDTEVWDDTVAVTDVTSGRTVAALGGEGENVTGCSFFQSAVDFSPDGSLLAATSHDYTVHVTTVEGDGDDGEVLDPHAGTVLDIEFSPDGALLATSSEDGTLRIWDVESMSLRDEFPTVAGGYWALAFAPDGSALAVSDITGAVALVDVASGETTRTFAGTKAQLGDMEFTPDGTLLVAGAPDGAVDVWSVDGGEVVQRLTGHTMAVTDVAVTDDGSAVVSSSSDGTVRSWPL